MGSRGSLTDRA